MTTAQPDAAPAGVVQHRLTIKEIVGYGAGDFANNLAFTTATSFLLIYYTDVACSSLCCILFTIFSSSGSRYFVRSNTH